MKRSAILMLGTLMALAGGCGQKSPLSAMEKDFRELPMDARRLTGPLFWLHGDESPELLQMYVQKVAEGGNGSFTAESRPHSDWLGEGWYRDLAICLQAAKKHDLKLWIFDEKWWPSGEVGGKVPPEYGCKTLEAEAFPMMGPGMLKAWPSAKGHLIGAVAGKEIEGGIDAASLIDLSPFIKDGALTWEAPAGNWKVMWFKWKYSTGRHILVDGASKDAVDWFIRTVYQPHYDRFKEDFGKTIVGYFYDEPETPGDWGTELNAMLAERGIDWKKAYVAKKFTLAGEEQAAARYQYQDALAEAWGRTLYGGITEWCRQHKVQSIGHFLEHSNLYLDSRVCAGNMFQLQKYSDMGAIDAVFAQFVMGQRITRDNPCWQTPKLGSSISHAYGKADDVAMVEIYGARGQDLTYPEMKWWLDHMQVSGINFIIPHSFNPRSPFDTDCPPYFYNNGHEPRWPLYRVLADYSSRLTTMLTGGRHVCPVALLYLGNSKHVGKAILPEQMSEVLQDALYDCDWLPYDVFENDATLDGKAIGLRQERYSVLVVPPVEVIPYPTLLKIKAFFDRGGVVVGHGFLPSKSATLGRTSQEIIELREAIWGKTPQPGLGHCRVSNGGGRSYLLPEKPTPEEIQQVLAGDAKIHPTLEVVQGQTDHWLHVLHRVKDGRDIFFIANQNHTGEARPFRFKVRAAGVPECWDAMRNQITAVTYERAGEHVLIDMTLQPLESVLLVFQTEARPLPMRNEGAAPADVAPLELVRNTTPPAAAPKLDEQRLAERTLRGYSWVWYPEGNPLVAAPPGTRYFRKAVELPANRRIREAKFRLAADNECILYVNGDEAGRSPSWKPPVNADVAAKLRPGANTLAVAATNGSTSPNPAGLIGRLLISFEEGEPMVIPIDTSWKSSNREEPGWNRAGFGDSAWPEALKVAEYGQGPWGSATDGLTLSPVTADPFHSQFSLPRSVDLRKTRVYLEMEEPSPEAAASVTVNGKQVGGIIGRPCRLEISDQLRAGSNQLEITPFAPRSARLVFAKRAP